MLMLTRSLYGTLLVLLVIANTARATDDYYYLDPLGDDMGLGTDGDPWQTLTKAIPELTPGDTLFIRGDSSTPYQGQDGVEIYVTGAAGVGNEITIRNAPGHAPVFSGTHLIDSGWQLVAGSVYKIALSGLDFPTDFRPLLVFQNPKGQTGGDFLSDPPDPVGSALNLQPGTWYFDAALDELHVWVNDLGAGVDPNAYTIEVGRVPSALGDRSPPFASHLVFEGIEFRGYTGVPFNDDSVAVALPGAITFTNIAAITSPSDRRNITIRGCTFRQNWKGLRLGAIHDLVIQDSVFSENIASGLSIGLSARYPDDLPHTTGFVMENSSILDTYGPWPNDDVAEYNPAAIKVHEVAGGAIRNVLVSGTHLNRNGFDSPHGIWTDVDVTDFVIENNEVRDIEGFASRFSGRGIFVERRAHGNSVKRNLVVNAQHGIVLGTFNQGVSQWPEDAEIYNNTVIDSLYNGIYVYGAVRPQIFNNIVVGTGHVPIRIHQSSLGVGASEDVYIEANGSWDTAPPSAGLFYALDDLWGSPANITAAALALETGVSGLTQEVNADPMFQDASNGDYSLSALSPAIDAGLPTGEPYNGTGIDLGYLEFPSDVPGLGAVGYVLLAVTLGAVGTVRRRSRQRD
jgi:parallel beta-helix repeat protein